VSVLVLVLAAALMGGRTCSAGAVRVREETGTGPGNEGGRELVVLLHGMKRTGRSMEKMARVLRDAGYDTAVVDYPSCWGVHETTTNVFAAVALLTTHASRVHFVTHSLGGILVRDAFREGAPENLGRVVMMGPPNGGCEHIDRFAWLPFFGAVWGTPARELGTEAESFPNRLPPIGFECGVIAGTKGGLLGLMLPGKSDGKVTVERAGEDGVKEVLVLPVNHTWMMRDKAAIAATARFLKTGRFGERETGRETKKAGRPEGLPAADEGTQ
jgi:pimeloyl-ACP methyl ester carboxylesterase